MALKAAVATGAWSAAATWNSITNTPTLHASSNVNIDSTARFTATFTAPNTVNACTGVLLHITAVGSAGTVTVTLQESTVDTAAARTINITALVANSWVYFTFATPYVFTTTGAGAYRFKVQTTGLAGTSNAAADSGGSLYCYLATDDRTGVPGSTDNVWITGQNQATAITVTMDGTQTIGAGTDTTGINRRTIGAAVVIANSGLLTWDTAASATLTSLGNVLIQAGGELRIGTVATPYPAAFVGSLLFNQNGTSTRYGLEPHPSGKLTLQGTPKTSTALWKTTYVSGAGTAASPMIVTDAVDWAVGDEIIVCAYSSNATNYNESENKFIKTKNSATSYVISDTSGGAEAALAFTHTAGAYIVNVQRNVIVKSTTTTESFYLYNANNVVAEVLIAWVRFETMGSNASSKSGVALVGASDARSSCDYSVAYRPLFRGFFFALDGFTTDTYTGLIGCNQNTASTVGAISLVGRGKALIDCFAVKNNRTGFEFQASGPTLTRCIAISNNTAGAGANNPTGGFAFTNAVLISFLNCEAHCNRILGTCLNGSTRITFTAYLSGSKGTNAIDISALSNTYNDATFVNSTFSSATFVSGYTSMLVGSEIKFQTYNATANNHTWYTNAGAARSTGPSLVDTTTKTAGNLAVRLAPENLTLGFTWEFLVGLRASSAASIFGFAQKNTAFGSSVCTIELFLPGSTVADATATLDNTTGSWQVFNLAANYTGSVAAFATIRITAKTATAAAYVYFTDFYNGTNVLTGLQAWYNGKPSPVLTDLLGDPASVWAILDSTLTTPGTIGYRMVNPVALQASVDDLEGRLTATRAGYLDNLSGGAVALQASVDDLEGRLTAGRAANLDNLDAAVSSGASQASVNAIAGYIDTEIGTLQASVSALNNLSANQVWDLLDGVETGLTPRQALRLVAAALAGLLSGASTTQITIKNAIVGDKNRIIATVDSDGNRTNIIYDVS